MRFHSLTDWLKWQEELHFTEVDLGLERCGKVARRMNLLSPEFFIVSIAGTNGKGSSANMLERILCNANHKIGTFTSPHLLRYNERIRIDGEEVSDDSLCHAFDWTDQARGDISLTYFEFGTLAALELFRESGVELAILEVGLGGRLDAVNILDADVALLCTIDLDHEYLLGNSRDQIGYEKAGIMRSNHPAVCSDPITPQSVISHALENDTELKILGRDFTIEINGDSWIWKSDAKVLSDLPKPSLLDNKQIQNAAGVLKVLDIISDEFPVELETIKASFKKYQLPGRFQVINREVPIVLDVAHNRQSAEGLVENLLQLSICGRIYLVIGMLKTKNHRLVIETLSKIVEFWYVVSIESDGGEGKRILCNELSSLGYTANVESADNVKHALETVYGRLQKDDIIVVTGSFLTVGAAMKWLKVEH